MCADARREGIQYVVGHPIPYQDSEGNSGTAPWWAHAREENLGKTMAAPSIRSWQHVDIPSDSFSERTVSNKKRFVTFPVPKGKVIGGVLVETRDGRRGISLVTRPITAEERAYAATQNVRDPNLRMPLLRDPLTRREEGKR